jgi:hypothetical protein
LLDVQEHATLSLARARINMSVLLSGSNTQFFFLVHAPVRQDIAGSDLVA